MCQLLCTRMATHRHDGKTQQTTPLYKLMNEYGADKFDIELVENYPCTNKHELLVREGHYIKERGHLIKQISGRSIHDWYEDNREKVVEMKQNIIMKTLQSEQTKKNTMLLTEMN